MGNLHYLPQPRALCGRPLAGRGALRRGFESQGRGPDEKYHRISARSADSRGSSLVSSSLLPCTRGSFDKLPRERLIRGILLAGHTESRCTLASRLTRPHSQSSHSRTTGESFPESFEFFTSTSYPWGFAMMFAIHARFRLPRFFYVLALCTVNRNSEVRFSILLFL